MRVEAPSTAQRRRMAAETIRAYQPVNPVRRRSSMGFSGFFGARTSPKAMSGMKLMETTSAATRLTVITIGRLWRNRPVSPVSIRNGR